MNVAAVGYWGIDSLDVALLDQNLAGFGAEVFHLLFADYLTFSQLFDLFVELAHYAIIMLQHISTFKFKEFITVFSIILLISCSFYRRLEILEEIS
jgi:hypothetical protein